MVAAVGALAAAGLTGAAPATGSVVLHRVVVTGSGPAAAAIAVQEAGGRVTAELPLIGGVVADLPVGAELAPGFVVTPDRAVTFTATKPAEEAPAGDAPTGGSSTEPTSTIRATLGLPPDGSEGRGVTVAVVDTGVANAADLAGRVVAHVDVTGTGAGDGYGHGTFMAGLIAGTGAASDGAYRGVAPGARVLDVKVARADGSTDLSTVLAGLQAVADNGSRYGVDVVNLSLSSNSPVGYQVDPLNQALRALWRRGVTVVVPAGNDGPAAGTVQSPGNDPTLLTVGAIDEHGTAARDDDDVASFSGRGPTRQQILKPDLAAPGTSVIGLRSPGSVIDTTYPHARIGEQYFRGSGSSMSTAVTSGVVAGVLAANPRLRPDDVKALLRGTAYDAAGLVDPVAAGTGGVDAAAALAQASGRAPGVVPSDDVAPGDAKTWKKLAKAFEKNDPVAAQQAWDELSPEGRSWAGRSWASLDQSTRDWVGRSWAGRSWATADVSADEWAGRSWAARAWSGDTWAADLWKGRSWAGEDWTGRSWAGRSWAGDDWAGRSWAGDDWAGRSWAASTWNGRSWAAAWE
jgi:serine protease AprX